MVKTISFQVDDAIFEALKKEWGISPTTYLKNLAIISAYKKESYFEEVLKNVLGITREGYLKGNNGSCVSPKAGAKIIKREGLDSLSSILKLTEQQKEILEILLFPAGRLGRSGKSAAKYSVEPRNSLSRSSSNAQKNNRGVR